MLCTEEGGEMRYWGKKVPWDGNLKFQSDSFELRKMDVTMPA